VTFSAFLQVAAWSRDCDAIWAPTYPLERESTGFTFTTIFRLLALWDCATGLSPIALEAMDRDGVAVGIGNVQGDPVLTAPTDLERRRAQVRGWNEFGAKVVASRPDKFGFFATLPMEDIDGTLREIDYAYTQLKADGCGIATSYADKWLGDSAFEPVFQETLFPRFKATLRG
jgi:hypothetical protein